MAKEQTHVTAGRAFATAVLEQDDHDPDVQMEAELQGQRREVVLAQLQIAMAQSPLRNPVLRALRRAARNIGCGDPDSALPASILQSMADRAWGKVKDVVEVDVNDVSEYRTKTDEELAATASELALRLREDAGVPEKRMN